MRTEFEDIRAMHEYACSFVEKKYHENGTPDFDIEPMIHAIKDGEHTLGALVGSPMDCASMAVKQLQPDMMSFISAIWVKDPEDPSIRVGEGVMVMTDTRDERLATLFTVERGPLPVLSAPKNDVTGHSECRAPLLYNPNVTRN